MVVNVQRLKSKIAEKENTQEHVADEMGMNRSTFYRKMKNGGNGFTVGDIHKMVSCVPLTREEAIDFFFT